MIINHVARDFIFDDDDEYNNYTKRKIQNILYQLFLIACKNNSLKIIKQLFYYSNKYECKIELSKTLLRQYAMDSLHRYRNVIGLLVKNNYCDVTFSENFLIRYYCKVGDTKMVKILLNNRRVNPDVHKGIARKNAMTRGHTKIVNLLDEYNMKYKIWNTEFRI